MNIIIKKIDYLIRGIPYMKKILAILSCLVIACFLSTGCAKTDVQDVFRFEAREINIHIGEEIGLKLVLGGIDKTKDIVFVASEKNIISFRGTSSTYTLNDTINGNDEILEICGLNAGKTQLKAYVKNNKNVYDTIDVTVTDTKISYMKVNGPSVLEIGQNAQLSTEILPANVSKEVVWSSSDENCIKIDQTGKATAYRGGTAIISATSVVDSTFVGKKEIKVEYLDASKVTVKAEGNTNLKINETLQLNATVTPALANQSVTWTSNDSKIVSVGENGSILAVASGSATITATSIDGLAKGTIVIEVSFEDPTEVKIGAITNKEYLVGETVKLAATVAPSNANSVVTWSSSDDEIATVNAKGEVKGIGPGVVTITATGAGGKVKDTLDITFAGRPDATGFEVLSGSTAITELEIDGGSSMQIKVTLVPAASDQDFTWEIENEDLVIGVSRVQSRVTIDVEDITGSIQETTVTFICTADPTIKFVLKIKVIPWE